MAELETSACCDGNVTSLTARIIQLMKSDPKRKWGPQEIAQILHAKEASVRTEIGRLSSFGKGSGPIVKVCRGFYQYHSEKNGPLSSIISRSGNVGIEALVYVASGTRPRKCQATLPCESKGISDNRRMSKSGYPRVFSTGQELRWEVEVNGSERISFVSNGRPFSVDLIIYLHEELERNVEFSTKEWIRVSIEINRDSERLTLNPECITFQETYGIFTKAYNHGRQARFEVADRTRVPLHDTVLLFLELTDIANGKAAMKSVEELSTRVKHTERRLEFQSRQLTKLLDKKTRESRKVGENRGISGDSKPAYVGFKTAMELKNAKGIA